MASTTHASCIVFFTEPSDTTAPLHTIQQEKCTALYGVPTIFTPELELLASRPCTSISAVVAHKSQPRPTPLPSRYINPYSTTKSQLAASDSSWLASSSVPKNFPTPTILGKINKTNASVAGNWTPILSVRATDANHYTTTDILITMDHFLGMLTYIVVIGKGLGRLEVGYSAVRCCWLLKFIVIASVEDYSLLGLG